MVTLYNVIDTRTNQYHSVAIVSQRKAKFFIPAEPEETE